MRNTFHSSLVKLPPPSLLYSLHFTSSRIVAQMVLYLCTAFVLNHFQFGHRFSLYFQCAIENYPEFSANSRKFSHCDHVTMHYSMENMLILQCVQFPYGNLWCIHVDALFGRGFGRIEMKWGRREGDRRGLQANFSNIVRNLNTSIFRSQMGSNIAIRMQRQLHKFSRWVIK